MLYVVVKEQVFPFDLRKYDFDVDSEIIPGKGNHLFKNTGPIKDVNNTIKSRLSRKEQIYQILGLIRVYAVFIADRHLNNMEIWHYIDFTVQVGAHKADVYFEKANGIIDMVRYSYDFLQKISSKNLIGSSGGRKGKYYKEKDNSIEIGEMRRIG